MLRGIQAIQTFKPKMVGGMRPHTPYPPSHSPFPSLFQLLSLSLRNSFSGPSI